MSRQDNERLLSAKQVNCPKMANLPSCLATFALVSALLGGLSLNAQDKSLRGFEPFDGQPRIKGFGLEADLHAEVSDADRQSANNMMGSYDLNRDGELDPQELRRAGYNRSVVLQTDANGDGNISLFEETLRFTKARLVNEQRSREQARQAKKASQKAEPPKKKVRPVTVDPMVLSRRNLCATLAGQLIAQHDRNGNKILELSEWRTSDSLRDVGRADTNGNRQVTAVELSAWLERRLPPLSTSRLAKPLRLLDSDGDGQISMNEYETEWNEEKLFAFQSLDQNDDGLISPKESHSPPIPRGAIRFANNQIKAINGHATIASNIWIEDDVQIKDLDVLVSMTKQNDHQLHITLTGPDKKSVTLFNGGWQPWPGTVFENTLIDDEAVYIAETLPRAPFPRRLRTDALKLPLQASLKSFNRKSARGTWQLQIRNLDGGAGVFRQWSIVITPARRDN